MRHAGEIQRRLQPEVVRPVRYMAPPGAAAGDPFIREVVVPREGAGPRNSSGAQVYQQPGYPDDEHLPWYCPWCAAGLECWSRECTWGTYVPKDKKPPPKK